MLKVLWKEAMKVHLAQRCLSWFGKLGACPSCSFVSGATTVPSMWKLMKRFHRAVKIPCAHAIGAGNMSQENERMCGEPSSAKLSGIKSGWCFLSTDVGLLCVQNLLWWLLRFLFLFFFFKCPWKCVTLNSKTPSHDERYNTQAFLLLSQLPGPELC